MADVMTPSERSRCMAAIRAADTSPELRVRRSAHALGYRYRLHVRELPGRPDLVFPRLRSVIFVHGCFWHQHTCGDGKLPASRRNYWVPKLQGNKHRDRLNKRRLKALGWRVLTIWECATQDRDALKADVQSFLEGSGM